MRIAIDNVSPGDSTSTGGKGGMRMYLQSLLREMLECAPQHQFTLLTPDWNASFNLPRDPRLEVVPLRSVPRGRVGRVLYERTAYASAIRRAGCDVFLGLCNTLPPGPGPGGRGFRPAAGPGAAGRPGGLLSRGGCLRHAVPVRDVRAPGAGGHGARLPGGGGPRFLSAGGRGRRSRVGGSPESRVH